MRILQENMESTGNHGGIQQLLAAEQEAQQIVNAARTGNQLQALFFFLFQSETLESLKVFATGWFYSSLHVLI